MLIRSQDKEVITNMAATNQIYVREIYRQNGSLFDISTDEMRLGYYSTKTKAIKVLDMIQEAYEEYKITCTFLTGFTGHRAIVESNDIHVDGFEELIKSFKKNMIFQIPADSEVVV